MEFFRKVTKVRFMERRQIWYAFSAAMILGSMLLVATRGLNFGIDFTGGVVLEFAFPQPANLEQVRAALDKAGLGDASVQSFGGASDVLVRVLPEDGADTNRLGHSVLAAIQSHEPAQLRRTEVVGPQVGQELAEKGALAVLFTFLLIMAYVAFRFQWKLGVGAIAAALHDPIVILGFFAVTGLTFDLPALAGILAVIGYSLNDTVVVDPPPGCRFHPRCELAMDRCQQEVPPLERWADQHLVACWRAGEMHNGSARCKRQTVAGSARSGEAFPDPGHSAVWPRARSHPGGQRCQFQPGGGGDAGPGRRNGLRQEHRGALHRAVVSNDVRADSIQGRKPVVSGAAAVAADPPPHPDHLPGSLCLA